MSIDVHAHAHAPTAERLAQDMPGYQAHLAGLARRYRDPRTATHMRGIERVWAHRLSDLPTRLADMDRAGVAAQLVSVNPGQYHHWADPVEAEALVVATNEDLAQLISRRPDRLAALGHVSLQHPELAAGQLDGLMRRPGFVGTQISSHAAGMDLSDRRLDDFWQVAEQHEAVVFLHPLGCPELTDRLAPSYLNNIIGQPVETTIALSHLIFTGVLDRHPRLRICAAHGGGYLPTCPGRSEHAYRVRPDSHSMAHPPSWYLRRMWFDTVIHSPAGARALIDSVGADRLVVGTDYPFDMGVDEPERFLAEVQGLDDADREAIRTDNARRLLGSRSSLLTSTAPDN
ncbi:amidohydrolase family protein [Streptomyces sp. NPDC020996]|uniref:amidohydrolase family protein n=1 Tax=Streptomyces sp. NPDC020996 TaxID=3154791 RepID=UPI0033FD5DD1